MTLSAWIKHGGKTKFLAFVVALLTTVIFFPSGQSLSDETRERVHLESGMAYLAAGKHSEAIGEFEELLKLNPSFADAHFHLSQAYTQRGAWDKALQHIDRAIQLNPKAPAYRNQRAMVFVQQDKFREAVPELLKAIELKPVNFLEFYYFNLARVYRSLLLTDEAIRAFEKVLTLASNFHDARVALGEIYLDRNLIEKSIQELSLAIALKPDLAKPYYLLGLARARSGDHSQAVEAFRKGLRLNPDDRRIHYGLGMSLKELGQEAEGNIHLDRFKTLQVQADEREYRDLQMEVAHRTDLQVPPQGSSSLSDFSDQGNQPPKPGGSVGQGPVLFHNVAREAGIRFTHVNGATPEKYMPETMGSGGLFFDYDDDGWIDIFLVNSGSLVDRDLAASSKSTLYRNNGDGTFRDVTGKSGISQGGYGMGACAADYDNDGRVDLYLTNFGPNALYRNNGNGTFTDITQKARVGSTLWSSSCAFADFDKDGDVDLFVVNYVDFALDNNKYCGSHVEGLRSYCHPHVYKGLPNVLYRNDGDGTFTEVTREAGLYSLMGKGLGVAVGDYNNDGWPDIYVANDSVFNFLYQNRGDGTFTEVGLTAGVAVDENGLPEAGMGTDWGDFDNDGWLDVYVTNLNLEMNTLYRNNGGRSFTDATLPAGVGEPTLPFVGFGTAFFDYDNDGHLDLVTANGHILDNVDQSSQSTTHAQSNLLFHNEGAGKFKEVRLISGPGFNSEKVSRGLAVGDIDNDGDLDLLINNCNQTADLLRNENTTRRNWITIKTAGIQSNRDGIGTRLLLKTGDMVQIREVKAGSSYQSQNDARVHFGLGKVSRVDRLELQWPSGTVDVLRNLGVNEILTIREGKGIVRKGPYRGKSQLQTRRQQSSSGSR